MSSGGTGGNGHLMASTGAEGTQSSDALLASAIDALRTNDDHSPPKLSKILIQYLSDNAPEGPSLERQHRRQLLRTMATAVDADTLKQSLLIAIPALQFHPNKTLVDFLLDLGPDGLPSEEVALDIYARFGISHSAPPSSQALFNLIVDMLLNYNGLGPHEMMTNMAVVMRSLSSLLPNVSWHDIVGRLDTVQELSFSTETRWDILAGILLHVTRSDKPGAPIGLILLEHVWSHPVRQLQILDGLTSLDEKVFSFPMLTTIPIVGRDDCREASQTVQQIEMSLENSKWNATRLIEIPLSLLDSEDPEVRHMANALIEKVFKDNAELLLMALLYMQGGRRTTQEGMFHRLFRMFLEGHPNHQFIFFMMWESSQDILIKELLSAYADNSMFLSRILDVCQDLKCLDEMLDQKPNYFALDLAALASRREFLNLDLWLQEEISQKGNSFVRATLDFVDAKVKEDFANLDPQAEQTSLPLTVHTVATFLRVLRANGDDMLPEEIDHFKAVRNLCLQLHPRLMNLTPGTESQEPGLSVATFPQEVHNEVDGYYRQMYEEQISIEDLVRLLQRTKVSDDPHKQQVFACMVHTLFDEYRCLESYYPPRELAMTAIVFGSLIQQQLIDFIPLGIAIRYVLDALRKPPESPMFKFGLQALTCFQERLPEWPQLSQALLSLPHIQQSHPEIVRIVRAAMSGQPVPRGNVTSKEERAPFSAIDPDPLPSDVDSSEPDEETSDKILFIINNMSPSNLDDKLQEARKLIKPELHHWLSSYLVLQRVSIEQNNHGLYTDFLNGLESPLLITYILHETLAKAKVLLNSEKTVQSTQERTILKNLGSWLGNLTLANNKPIRHRNVAFKELLIEGYDSSRLIVAIPFVCKVLEQCSRSTIFKPPNPWLMAMLRLLVELYQFAELKLNLKFEIEVLCKSLNVDLKDVQCTTIIRNRPQELATRELQAQQAQQQYEAQLQQQQQLQRIQQQASRGQYGSLHRSQQVGNLTQDLDQMSIQNRASDSHSVQQYPDTLASILQTLPAYIVFNSSVAPLATNAGLKRMICISIERAIREIIHPVVERSVTIAAVSTKELVTKDFAMESDENKMHTAAHQMAQNLAGSLALVTCKEPLRIAMLSTARNLFLQNGFTEQTLPEQAIATVIQDNLELACSVVERAAMERSLQHVDDQLANAYVARRDHRLRGRGFYWDANALAQSQYASTLPDLLKLKPDGLQSQQLRVYEEFGKLPKATGEGASRDSMSPPSVGLIPDAAAFPPGVGDVEQRGISESAPLSPRESLEKLTHCTEELVKLLHQGETREQNVEIRELEQQIPALILQSSNRDDLTLSFSQKVVQLLYKSDSDIAREAYIHILERLCELSLKAAKEVTAWLIYAEDERKFNVPATVGLMRAGLINVAEQDAQLAKFIYTRDFKASIVDFAAKLAYTCLTKPAFATRQQLSNIISALVQAHELGRSTKFSDEFLRELQDGNLKTKWDMESAQPLREQLAYCFAEWVRLYQQSPNAEKSFIDFVRELQNQGILKGEEISSMFFRVCTEVGVDSYIKQKAVGGDIESGIFQPVDAFSKLIVLMIKYHAGVHNEQAKVHYLTKILSIVVLVFAQSHEELGPHFQQKPFFRLFSSLLYDLNAAQASLGNTYFQSLLAIGNTLNTLQPSFFPGFAFSWMSLISHRLFLPKLLGAPLQTNASADGSTGFLRLYASLLRFLAPFVRANQLYDASRVLFKGTLRITLVLLHDYPEFLATSHQTLCDLIPTQCVQLRNLVLSSFPRTDFSSGLPDVFKANLSIKDFEQCKVDPALDWEYVHNVLSLAPDYFRTKLDKYLTTGDKAEADVLEALHSVVKKDNDEFAVPLLNAIVLHAGVTSASQAVNILVSGDGSVDPGVHVLEMLMKLGPEGNYLTANALCNQLRYPNRHTAYFSTALLYIYEHDRSSREALLRVLLERIVVNRPHPWGLLITIVEIVSKEQQYPLPEKVPIEILKILERVRNGLGIPRSTHEDSYNDIHGNESSQ